MPNFNKVILAGHLTRDPELKYTMGGSPVCSFTLAINQKYKSGDTWKEDASFVDITVWNKTAEACGEYLDKGAPVMLEGRLKTDSWEKDGRTFSKLTVVANNVQFLGKGKSSQREQEDIPF